MEMTILKLQNEIEGKKVEYEKLVLRNNNAKQVLKNENLKNIIRKEQEEYYSNLLKALNRAITDEAQRIQRFFGKETLGSKELADFFQVSRKNIGEKLYHDVCFPAIYITSKRKGITPLGLVIYTLTGVGLNRNERHNTI
ncbi:MAG: hypothetical protein RSB90_10685 [Eubacterium sp.]